MYLGESGESFAVLGSVCPGARVVPQEPCAPFDGQQSLRSRQVLVQNSLGSFGGSNRRA
jgi:hypothetical protein